MSSSSSDSDSSEKAKNIRCLLIKSKSKNREPDESCSYKKNPGDLIFNSNFEGGNLGYIERIDDTTYDLMARPDVANPHQSLWFNFTVSNQRLDQCVIFNFVNLSETLGLFLEGLTPVVRSHKNPNWIRLDEDQVFYYKSPQHSFKFVLSIAFRFESFDNQYQFALFYPYTLTTLTNFIDRWEVSLKRRKLTIEPKAPKQRLPFEKCRSVTPDVTRRHVTRPSSRSDLESRSLAGSRCSSDHSPSRRIEASPLNKKNCVNLISDIYVTSTLCKPLYHLGLRNESFGSPRPKVIVLCRLSSGNIDSCASFVCQGIVDYLLSNDRLANYASKLVDFCIFPMLDPDSIWVGNSRSDLFGQTRITSKLVTTNPNVYGHLVSTISKIEKLCSESSNTRIIILELTVNVDLIGSRIKGTNFGDIIRMERHLSFPKILAKFADDFYLENCEFLKMKESLAHDKSDRELFNLLTHKSNLDHYELEISPFAYHKRSLASSSYEPYTQIKYLSLGKAIIYSVVETFKDKNKPPPRGVQEILESFLPRSEDIDGLVLKAKE